MTRTRGLASLGLVVVWLVAASLVMLYASRALIFEQRASANQLRSTVAFEAAEAGAEWALAGLGHPGPVDPQCQAAAAPGDGPLRERLLRVDTGTGRVSAGPAQAGCSRAPGGPWQCSCPRTGSPVWTESAPAAQAFALEVVAGNTPGSFGLVSMGCANAARYCTPGTADAQARVTVTVAPLPLLAHPPSAALVAQTTVSLGAGTLLINSEAASGGITAMAGAAVSRDATAQQISLPGRPGTASVIADDASLQPVSVFTLFLGLGPAAYRDLPGVKVLACGSACRSQHVSTAWAAGAQPVLWIEGGLALDADLPLGTAQDPVLLIVDGPLRLTGAQQPWGLVLARSVTWTHTGGGIARWRGAVVARESVALSGGVQVMFDSAVLQRLTRLNTFVRVPGGWRDFELKQ